MLTTSIAKNLKELEISIEQVKMMALSNCNVNKENIPTLDRFSSCKRHVSSSTRFSSLSLASLSAPVSLAA